MWIELLGHYQPLVLGKKFFCIKGLYIGTMCQCGLLVAMELSSQIGDCFDLRIIQLFTSVEHPRKIDQQKPQTKVFLQVFFFFFFFFFFWSGFLQVLRKGQRKQKAYGPRSYQLSYGLTIPLCRHPQRKYCIGLYLDLMP